MKKLLRAAYQPYKWFFVIPFMIINTLVHALLCLFAGLLFGKGAGNLTAVSWSKLGCLIAPVRVKFYGRKNYDTTKSYVVVANHQSMVDIPVLHGWLGLKIKWVMKKELKRIPVFGHACESLGCIYIDRADHDKAVQTMEEAQKELDKSSSVIFFPEGTRTRDGKLLPFKKGAFRFAIFSGLPILPVTIKNTMTILPSDTLDLFPGTAHVVIHPPATLSTEDLNHLDERIAQIRETIGNALT